MKTLIKLQLLFILVFSGISLTSKATHITGGEITYQCIGQDSFYVTLTLLRDCSGVGLSTTAPVSFTNVCGHVISQNLTLSSTTEISQLCPTQISNSTCNGGAYTGTQKYEYTGVVVLNAYCATWNMSWSSCCRPNVVSNLLNPGGLSTYLYSSMGYGVDSCNRSPYFTTTGNPTVYSNRNSTISVSAVDPDGDSLVYFLSPGYQNSTSLVTYGAGYTYGQPLPGSNAVLNSFTGELTFNANLTGSYSVVVRVEEYDRPTGVFKGSILRDFIVNVEQNTQKPPTLNSASFSNLGDGTFSNDNLTVCSGDSVDFNISVNDSNSTDVVTLLANFSSVFDTTAIISVTGTNPAIMNIKWLVQNIQPGKYGFNVTAMDDNCPSPGYSAKVFSLTLNEGVNAGPDKSICAGQFVEIGDVGGTSNTWTVISGSPINTNSASSGYNMSCTNCLKPMVSPQTTTTYVLTTNLTGTCGNMDTVTVNVLPDFSVTTSANTSICGGDSASLSATPSLATGTYTYKWMPNTGLNSNVVSSPIASPLNSTKYYVHVTNGACARIDSVDVNVVSAFPQGNSVQGDTIICQGESSFLSINLGNYPIPDPCLTTDFLLGKEFHSTVGTGTYLSNGTPSIAPDIYTKHGPSAKFQMLFTAAELKSSGFQKGKIKGISFNLSGNSSPVYYNLNIKMGCTDSIKLNTLTWITGLQQVMFKSSHTPGAGWDYLNFDQGYYWDGSSNIVIEICHADAIYSGSITALNYSTQTSFESTSSYVSSNVGIVACSQSSPMFVHSTRPNTRFHYYDGLDTNGYQINFIPNTNVVDGNTMNPIVTPLSTTTYQVVISDTGGACSDTLDFPIHVSTSEFDAGFIHDSTYCLNDGVQTLLPITNGGIFTGVGVSSNGIFDPAAAGVGTWPINYNIPTPVLCSSDSTNMITVISLPDASIDYTEICVGSSSVTLSAATSGGVWYGNNITDSINGVFDPSGLPAGDYQVIYTLTSPCYSSDTTMVKIIDPFQFTFNNATVQVCENDSLDLVDNIVYSNSPTQGEVSMVSFTDQNGLVTNEGMFSAVGVPTGFYLVTVTVSDLNGGCATTQNMTVEVLEVDYAFIIDEPSYCSSQNSAKIFVNPWLFGSGITFTQRPLGSLGANDTLQISSFGQNGQFNPQTVGVGSWEITIQRQSTFGCIGETVDTIYVLDAPDTSITNTGLELTANAGQGYVYQWLDCDNNMSPVSGATSQTFIPGGKGNYAVQIKAGNCVETSGCHATWPVSTQNLEDLSIEVYPNPVGNELFVETGVKGELQIELLDNVGKSIWLKKSSNSIERIDMSHYPSGVYIVKISSGDDIITQKVVKE